jgi:hypothetical protein
VHGLQGLIPHPQGAGRHRLLVGLLEGERLTRDDWAELMEEPPGGLNHGRTRTESGWKSLEPNYAEGLDYIIDNPEYRHAERYEHGTIARYNHGPCRCDECKQAKRDYMREWRTRRGGV